MNDADIHYISAVQLMHLHGVDPRECIVIENNPRDPRPIRQQDEWPKGYGPLHTEELREAAGLTLLTPAFRGNYGEDVDNA